MRDQFQSRSVGEALLPWRGSWGNAPLALGGREKCLNQVFIFNQALNCLSIRVQQR